MLHLPVVHMVKLRQAEMRGKASAVRSLIQVTYTRNNRLYITAFKRPS